MSNANSIKQSTVSVIIPTWNRAEMLVRSVKSVLAQTHQNLEVVIIDDGSTDDTEEQVARLKDERISYHCLSKNSGAAKARNIGVEKAQNSIIAFHDSDDVWVPDKLEKQLTYWYDHPEYVMVYCAISYYDEKKAERVSFPFADIDRNQLSGNMYEFLLHRNTIDTPTILLKKETFLNAGGFDTLYPPLEDWEFNLRISQIGQIGYVDEPLVNSTITAGSLSSSVSAYYNSRCLILKKHLQEIISRGLFDEIAGDILGHAEHDGVLEPVKKMMMLHLAN